MAELLDFSNLRIESANKLSFVSLFQIPSICDSILCELPLHENGLQMVYNLMLSCKSLYLSISQSNFWKKLYHVRFGNVWQVAQWMTMAGIPDLWDSEGSLVDHGPLPLNWFETYSHQSKKEKDTSYFENLYQSAHQLLLSCRDNMDAVDLQRLVRMYLQIVSNDSPYMAPGYYDLVVLLLLLDQITFARQLLNEAMLFIDEEDEENVPFTELRAELNRLESENSRVSESVMTAPVPLVIQTETGPRPTPAFEAALQSLFSQCLNSSSSTHMSVIQVRNFIQIVNGTLLSPQSIQDFILHCTLNAGLDRRQAIKGLCWQAFLWFFVAQSLEHPNETRQDLLRFDIKV